MHVLYYVVISWPILVITTSVIISISMISSIIITIIITIISVITFDIVSNVNATITIVIMLMPYTNNTSIIVFYHYYTYPGQLQAQLLALRADVHPLRQERAALLEYQYSYYNYYY